MTGPQTQTDRTTQAEHAARRARSVAGMFALAVILASIAACKTTEGAGKDIENLGENIQDAAD